VKRESDPDGLLDCALVAGHTAGHRDRKAGKATVQMCPPEYEPGSWPALAWRTAYTCAFYLAPGELKECEFDTAGPRHTEPRRAQEP
jgi:hypothetical protein